MKTTVQVVDERWRHRDLISTYGGGRHAGVLATQSWLSARGFRIPPGTPWEVAVWLDVIDEPAPATFSDITDTRFHVALSSKEWGFFFCHHGRASWIRVTDVPFVHERDDFGIFYRTPPLRHLGGLVRALEEQHAIRFRREHALIRSTIAGSVPAIWDWVLANI